MKKPLAVLLCFISISLFSTIANGQFGTFASAVWISDCSQSNFFNTTGTAPNLFGPSGNVFSNSNLGVHTQNSGTLILRGAGVKTSKTPGTANVCSVRMHYRIYLQSGAPGAFNIIDLPLYSDCDIPSGQFPGGGGTCVAGDQIWQRVIPDGTTVPYSPVNLTNYAPGNYVLEVYYDVSGSNSSTTGCSDQVNLNNGGNNYKAFFSIQSPTFASNNPVTCNGNEGYITISGLVAGATYSISYTDDGVPVGPLSLTANASGQVVISGLNAGLYSNFSLLINGCTTNLFIGIVLSNPIFIPTFASIPPICAGTTPPALPPTSTNGIGGVWNPSVIDNSATGPYTFTPTGGQCGIPITITVTVIPRTTPTFSFGTSLNICAGGAVPALPNTSTNGITGIWNPAIVNPNNSGTYTFTPNAGQCANPATFAVTVTPNITPTFEFNLYSICAGSTPPVLPLVSLENITGTWSPAVVSNQNTGIYTFTPDPGQCAITTSAEVDVIPNVTPTFNFGTSLAICTGGTVPVLTNWSNEGFTGVWSPAVVSNTASGNYTFTPDAGQCAIPVIFSVTVNASVTPTFSFGTSLTICGGGTVPTLPTTSINGIAGTWSPSVVSNNNSGIYTFTPTSGACVLPTIFTVTVNPIITPTFSFGTSLTICSGTTAPVLPGTSTNGVTGTWNPAVIDSQNSGTYTFTPTIAQCTNTTNLTVTVTTTITPVFSFGTSLSICAGGTVPTLPSVSNNGVNGTWNPAVVNTQNSGTYTFTPTPVPGQCLNNATFAVTVNPILTPTFSFGSSLSICIGGSVPFLSLISQNGVSGIWNPSSIDNLNSGTYTFTPTAGQCANPLTLTVSVNEIPTIVVRGDTSLNDGDLMPATFFTGTPVGISYNWTNSNPSIGLTEFGTGHVPAFIAANTGNNSVTATITVVPMNGGCAGTSGKYNITVKPLNKDVFVPNVFSPNGDGKNDKLFVYGNYISKVEMRIFNQWGEQIIFINSLNQGWDGKHRGKPQPVGVYVYVLKAVMTDGRVVNLKGSITLLR
jgi:large repetitive protein